MGSQMAIIRLTTWLNVILLINVILCIPCVKSSLVKKVLQEQEKRDGLIAAICAGT